MLYRQNTLLFINRLKTLILIYVFGLGEAYSIGYNYSLFIHFIASLVLLYNWGVFMAVLCSTWYSFVGFFYALVDYS